MSLDRRTDLAIEAKELYETSTKVQSSLHGVVAREEMRDGFSVHCVEVRDEEGARALGKAVGTYYTITTTPFTKREEGALQRGKDVLCQCITAVLGELPNDAPVLVVGLGNRDITPDALGPLVWDRTLVTRHLVTGVPEYFGHLRPVSAVATGVLGTTGVESGELVASLVRDIAPSAVIAVDALASRSLTRLCNTVQISDTGIAPGSGVGNHRHALTRAHLGVPVIAIGVPTVVDGGTMAADLLELEGRPELGRELFVTPRDIDYQVAEFAKLIGGAIGQALHPMLSVEDFDLLTG